MTTRPHDYADRFLNTFQLQLLNIGAAALAGTLLVGAIAVRESKFSTTLLLAAAAGVSTFGYTASVAQTRSDRIRLDDTDASDQVRQQLTYEALLKEGRSPMAGSSPVLVLGEPTKGFDLEQFTGVNTLESEGVPMYELRDIAGENHLAVIGASGSGKTVLTQYLMTTYFPEDSKITVMDTDAKPGDWPGLKVLGQKGNTTQIEGHMNTDLRILQKRTELNGDGKPVGNDLVSVIEEHATVASDIQDDIDNMPRERGEQKPPNTATNWLKRLLRRGRKYKMMVVLVSQSFNVKTLKIEGEGDLRENLTVIYLGAKALKAASTIKNKADREAMQAWLATQNRPAVADVGGVVLGVAVPDLTGYRPEGMQAGIAEAFEFEDVIEDKPVDYQSASAAGGSSSTVILDSLSEGKGQYMHKLISSLLDDGMTKTQILQEHLGLSGSRYQSKALPLWDELISEYGEF